ncbi:BTAD domain-containing putative transcriptional regulator [Micromonospora haikouensis]|uniref:AfsR/SARP family transcriptional regulator n=1 Tax=Micromonospora haikouensis TaxID=686309 RepID=UPI0033E95404
MFEVRLLGPIEINLNGKVVDVGPPQRRAVLAALAVDLGRRVSAETLIDRVWSGSPPIAARRALHAHLARIRRLLAEVSAGQPRAIGLVRRNGEYQLEAQPTQVDMHRFHCLVEHGRSTDRTDAQRAYALREALALWRGTPMGGLSSQWAMGEQERWRRLRLDAAVAWANAELRSCPNAPIIGRLYELVDEYPLAEPMVASLMRALHAAGRSAEAVECFFSVRLRLAEDLGIEPSEELCVLHGQILRGTGTPSELTSRLDPCAGREAMRTTIMS